jgi:hypothetical protein
MAAAKSLALRKFNIQDIKDDKVVVLIGRRETGKSYLTKDILYRHRDIPMGTAISGTEAANGFYSKILPPLFIQNEYKPAIIANIMKRQRALRDAINEEISTKGTSKIDPRFFLILDDCLYDNCWTKDVNIRSVFMNGRHWKILAVFTMQYPLGIPPQLRTNVDFTFILREPYVKNRRIIYENYAGMFPSFEVFCQVMDQCTENFECLVINNNAKSNRIEDMVFWYKADQRPDFRIGAPEFWSSTPGRPLSTPGASMIRAEDGLDASDYKRRGPTVTVRKNGF